MSPTVYLISGANRGIGLGLVNALAIRDNVIIFAGARNHAGASDLHALSQKYPGKVYVVKLTSTDKKDNDAAVAEIKRVAGKLDVVIANAAISTYFGPTLDITVKEMLDHYEVNVAGPLVLFQATYPLLKENKGTPKFIPISSSGGSIADAPPIPLCAMVPYSASKSALNFVARRLHFEYPDITVIPLNPGPVETDMSVFAKKKIDLTSVTFLSVDESVKGLLREIDNGTRESSGGQFVDYTGSRLNW